MNHTLEVVLLTPVYLTAAGLVGTYVNYRLSKIKLRATPRIYVREVKR